MLTHTDIPWSQTKKKWFCASNGAPAPRTPEDQQHIKEQWVTPRSTTELHLWAGNEAVKKVPSNETLFLGIKLSVCVSVD